MKTTLTVDENGILTFPNELMKETGWKEGDMPYAEKYYKNCISLPMYPTLKQEEQDFVIKTIND